MNYKDAFYKTVHNSPGGCEALAVRMGYTAGLLRNKANPNSTTNVLTMDDASRAMDITGDYEVLHALAREHGFICTKLDQPVASDVAVLESVTDIWAKLGTVGTQVHTALADGRIDQREVKHIEAAIFTAIRPMMDLLTRLNGMAEKG
ncbi:phage regulatory CII family protein [Massilia oculi]|uniref:Phage regulatory CII family protein n=1 Tax=Massilia hydrophila TaxID=3044279 RepID=A0ABS7YCJ7_9BURK|nr:phage regulatory CII family protein [Massilia oculi]MCA1857429.1 phage regulatory CII family protein [Massilia oculi]